MRDVIPTSLDRKAIALLRRHGYRCFEDRPGVWTVQQIKDYGFGRIRERAARSPFGTVESMLYIIGPEFQAEWHGILKRHQAEPAA